VRSASAPDLNVLAFYCRLAAGFFVGGNAAEVLAVFATETHFLPSFLLRGAKWFRSRRPDADCSLRLAHSVFFFRLSTQARDRRTGVRENNSSGSVDYLKL